MLLNIIAVIFVFSILVVIHELGHFLAAKWMGVRVEKFSIGFPPTLYKKKIGETEFSISAIPLGGYVKMAGFIDESLDDSITGADYEFNSKPVWKRIIIIVAGIVMNVFLAITILTGLTLSQGEKILPTTRIGVVGEKGVAAKIGFQKGDEIISVNNQSVENWNDIRQAFVENLNNEIVFQIRRGGNTQTLVYKKEWFAEEKGEQLDIEPLASTKLGEVHNSMPAGSLGLKTGDVIVAVAGKKVDDWPAMTKLIRAHPGEEIDLEWLRDGQLMKGKITPQITEETNPQGITEKIGKIGIGTFFEHRKIAFFPAVLKGVSGTYNLVVLNIRSLYWVLSGTKAAKEIIGGPVMIAKMAGDAAHAGMTYLWYLIAALSAVLAFFNILPIPGLDGGHLVFLILEGVRGKPIPVNVKIRIQQVGMAILLSLIIFVTYIDITR